jgi:hypothetical protein
MGLLKCCSLYKEREHSLCTCFEECATSISDVIDNDGHPVRYISHQHHSVHLIGLLSLEGVRERERKGEGERGTERMEYYE